MTDKDLDEQITIRLSAELRQKLVEISDRDDRRISAVARRLLRQALKTQEELAA
jgi:predicted transcriptional regulator